MRYKRNLTLLGVLLTICWFVVAASAHASSVSEGISWLQSNQDATGLWGTGTETRFRDSAVALELLVRLGADSSVIGSGLRALRGEAATSTDYIARKSLAMSAYGVDLSAASVLANRQNSDGGWGYSTGYESDVLDASLALRALSTLSAPDTNALAMGASYLLASQNADGGWGLASGHGSRVFYTAHAIAALAAVRSLFVVESDIQQGVDWLQTQVNADGGFGFPGQSNVFETSLAIAAVFQAEPGASELIAATAYLEAHQLPDGSWGDDAYLTALAVHGLSHIGPDLAVGTADISFSDPAPVDSALVTVSATVHNSGTVAANNVLVRFYDGQPTAGGAQIGTELAIPSIAAGGSSDATAIWNTVHLAGDHLIVVVVDPLNTVVEPNETNNRVSRAIHVLYPSDLLIDNASIVFDPLEPEAGQEVIIRTTVRNVGEVAANGIELQLWDVPSYPGEEGTPLLGAPYSIATIAAGSQFTLNLSMGNYFATDGPYSIQACADVSNAIREVSEANNCGYETVWIGPQPYPLAAGRGLNLLGLPNQSSGDRKSVV